MSGPEAERASDLLSAAAVRKAAARMLNDGIAGGLTAWRVNLDRLPSVARYVADETRANYPDLNVPLHARWRHFSVGGLDRWAVIERSLAGVERARAAFDLAIVSVLLDAGSGGRWSYHDPATGQDFRSSEGLAVASFNLFASGRLSASASEPWRADGERLAALSEDNLRQAFQVSISNPLAGVTGRAALLNRLGRLCLDRPDLFGIGGIARPGGLFERVALAAPEKRIPASRLLRIVLEALWPVWPERLRIGGVDLGDCWRYPPWRQAGDTFADVVPFHKLSQWLAYSLIEPTCAAGINVTNLDGLTGLPEYRNGGLFVDCGVLAPHDTTDLDREYSVGDPLIVEWRALTVALLDRLAPLVRDELGVPTQDFPLAAMLQGGTWSAGRRIAREKRADGSPPVRIVSDGATF